MPIDPNNLAATATLTFSDDFDTFNVWTGPSSGGVWSTNWWYRDEWGLFKTSNGSNLAGPNELQWYINYNYEPTRHITPWTVSDGVLNLTVTRTDPANVPTIPDLPYTSGMINSWHSFSQQYGYFEISAKMPAGKGLWPAFWLLPQDGSWPPEIDVFEVLGRDTTSLHVTIHSNETGTRVAQGVALKTPDLSLDFHRYGVDWQKDYVTFYFDGMKIAQYATPADMHKPMYMVANVSVGGWAGTPDASTVFPASLQIDYIRAYSALPGSEGAAPSPPTVGLTLTGTAGHDMMRGGDGNDVIRAGAGNDTIEGLGGNDEIEAADGHDWIHGNAGADTIYSGAGNDTAQGGKDGDLIYGGAGDDIVYGNLGEDTLWGGAGNDTIRGGQDNDSVHGGDGNDWLAGDRGDDTIFGGAGADTFHSFEGAGLDRILDFKLSEGDRIELPAGTAWTLSQAGADAVIHLADAQIVLVGVSAASLTGDWLTYA
ncbi:MAG: family 16 glycosylhydrolase [Phenylobacterium sp.]|uniref:family 16 glycosylhydrolase n=1 Tax=Phenylobacterium sp. TaxID=1871053 RepID=UPI003919983C